MLIKLNYDRATGLYQLIIFLMETYPPEDKAEKLLHMMVNKVRIKLRNKLESLSPKTSYSISITDEEALSLDLYMSSMEASIKHNTYIYEKSVAKEITNEIDRVLG